ncbi:YbaB/EbfC family nucleoid-associated protein [Micromonospora auratinigra]|uniref:YbaB/EbfC DNA-binding family protein n=1 Tax=Micromonospora auratinigra TaxID=261654 RepID=A0A1A8ZGV7_9ACTN|nr:YbaB/EbfC family nucleoid-associated protein [Micromonospora auratinigra]SBT43101.1 YbaB/EbfC DNA-binding family protein [Micromonospora auratinigra]
MESGPLGDSRILEPDGDTDRLRAWKGQIDKLAADTKVMGERLQELRVTERDRDGLAEVTVDSTGALRDLRLSRQIQQRTPDEVAQAVMATVRQARAQLAERSQQIVAETVGTQSPAARALAERVHRGLAPAEQPDSPEPGRYDGSGWQGDA